MDHQSLILDQFSRQAQPFADKPEHSDEVLLRRLVGFSQVQPTDVVLDVACGPGILACVFARVAQSVTGIDLTPAMIDLAGKRQHDLALNNLKWQIGDVTRLPYPEGEFDLTLSRYAFHHFTDPLVVLREMVRVTRPGGRVMLIDVAPPSAKAAAYDRAEKLRDPSHTQAVPLEDYPGMMIGAGLVECRQDFYRLGMRIEALIASSFPNEGAADQLRRIYRDDLERDDLGLGVYEQDAELFLSFPTAVIIGRKASVSASDSDPRK